MLKGGKQKTRRHLWPLGNVSKHSSKHPTSNTHILGLGQVICLPWTFKGSGQETLPSCRLERHIGGRVYKLKGREMDVRIFQQRPAVLELVRMLELGVQLVSDDIGRWWQVGLTRLGIRTERGNREHSSRSEMSVCNTLLYRCVKLLDV